VVGLPVDQLPSWLQQWSRLVPNLVSFADVNSDGVIQANELFLSNDVVMLVMPEISGMPYVITAMVAAGALAAALSTADGLLLAITAALSRDLLAFPSLRRIMRGDSGAQDITTNRERGLIGSKVILLSVAVLASYVAAQRPAGIVAMVTLAFSLAASTFFVPLIAAIFWKKANRYGAVAAMITGPSVTLYYWFHLVNQEVAGLSSSASAWLGIKSAASGVFGVLAAWGVMLIVSLLTSRYSEKTSEAVNCMQSPRDVANAD
jgi:cation/acetate symporter